MPRNIPLYILAALIGGLIAFAYVKPVGAQECVSVDLLLEHAEKLSEEHEGHPFSFVVSREGDKTTVRLLFSAGPFGLVYFWKDGQCAPNSAQIPRPMAIQLLTEAQRADLLKQHNEWLAKRHNPKGTGI
jgi:hypothetical protein